MRARQVKVRQTWFCYFPVLASVHLGNVALLVKDGHDQRAGEVFVSCLADESKFLQACPDLCPGLPALLRKPKPKRPIGEAKLKAVNGFVIVQTTLLEILKSRRRLEQTLVIIVHGLKKKPGIISIN